MSKTIAQARDALLECRPLFTEVVRDVKNFCVQANDLRKADPETYFECPRCRGYHSVRGNFDNLCDGCCHALTQDFPWHPAVPEIRRCGMQWHKPKTP